MKVLSKWEFTSLDLSLFIALQGFECKNGIWIFDNKMEFHRIALHLRFHENIKLNIMLLEMEKSGILKIKHNFTEFHLF